MTGDDPDAMTVDDLVRAHDLAVSEAEWAAAEAALDVLDVHRLVVTPGDPIDPAVHHVVEVVPPGPGHAPAAVIDVVRPGWVGPQGVVRPSEVRAAGAGDP